MYCVKCRKQTDTSNEMGDKDSRGRDRVKVIVLYVVL